MSRYFEPSSMARAELSVFEQIDITQTAKRLGVCITTTHSVRRDCWRVVVTSLTDGARSVALEGAGALTAVVAGALDDFAALDYSPDELAVIREQSEDGPPPDINREGLPEFNGSFG